MFSTSTQMKYWTFPNVSEIERLREEANVKYVTENSAIYTVNDPETERDEQLKSKFFLDAGEESKLRKHYEYVMRDFCLNFEPSMPKYVLGTAMSFFKRVYLHNSVMDYHPKDFVYTCVYLACKVEEFNVTINQFVANMKGQQRRGCSVVDIILSQELLLMQMLHYHLTVHNPYRPIEGLLIDIKTRCTEVDDPEKLRAGINEFLDKAVLTDVSLLFSPSQIALAAILTSASNRGQQIHIDSYVANKLFDGEAREALKVMIDHVQKIRSMVKCVERVNRTEINEIEEKLALCRNHDNDPENELYRQQVEDNQDNGDEMRAVEEKRLRLSQDAMDEDSLGL